MPTARALCLAAAAVVLAMAGAVPASAGSGQHHGLHGAKSAPRVVRRAAPRAVKAAHSRVSRSRIARNGGYRPLYSDGTGSSFGFHPGPFAGDGPLLPGYRARPPWARHGNGLRETIAIDLLTRGNGYAYGYPF